MSYFFRCAVQKTWGLYFAHDMGVCDFWVCPTTPMTSTSTISHLLGHLVAFALSLLLKYSTPKDL